MPNVWRLAAPLDGKPRLRELNVASAKFYGAIGRENGEGFVVDSDAGTGTGDIGDRPRTWVTGRAEDIGDVAGGGGPGAEAGLPGAAWRVASAVPGACEMPQ